MTKGFTLIELLIVIALLAILSALAVPVSFSFYRSQAVEGSKGELMEILNRARRHAVLQKGDSRYGVQINTSGDILSEYILYKGDSYDDRDDTYDELYDQPPKITIEFSGSDALSAKDINFAKLSGVTSATGTITIGYDGFFERRALIIDSFGNVYATSTEN